VEGTKDVYMTRVSTNPSVSHIERMLCTL